MLIRVKLFGPEARAAGRREVELNLPDASPSAEHVLTALAQACPALAANKQALRLAINHAFAASGDIVAAGDELAIIGAVSGG